MNSPTNISREGHKSKPNENKLAMSASFSKSSRGLSAGNKKSEMQVNKLSSLITQTTKQSEAFNPTNLAKSAERLHAIHSLSPPKRNIYESLIPAQSSNKHGKKTLVLDLDETLIHSGKIEIENRMNEIFVVKRPWVDEFLKRMGKLYEIVIFTASLSKYADPLIDILDPGKVCSFRLFRESCTMINGFYVKELKKLNRNMKNNNPASYYLDVENGLPIKSFYEDKSDYELELMYRVLEGLSHVNDVRDYIKEIVEGNSVDFEKAEAVFSNLEKMKEEEKKKISTPKEKITNLIIDNVSGNSTNKMKITVTNIEKLNQVNENSEKVNKSNQFISTKNVNNNIVKPIENVTQSKILNSNTTTKRDTSQDKSLLKGRTINIKSLKPGATNTMTPKTPQYIKAIEIKSKQVEDKTSKSVNKDKELLIKNQNVVPAKNFKTLDKRPASVNALQNKRKVSTATTSDSSRSIINIKNVKHNSSLRPNSKELIRKDSYDSYNSKSSSRTTGTLKSKISTLRPNSTYGNNLKNSFNSKDDRENDTASERYKKGINFMRKFCTTTRNNNNSKTPLYNFLQTPKKNNSLSPSPKDTFQKRREESPLVSERGSDNLNFRKENKRPTSGNKDYYRLNPTNTTKNSQERSKIFSSTITNFRQVGKPLNTNDVRIVKIVANKGSYI